jgi:hypothetical protein
MSVHVLWPRSIRPDWCSDFHSYPPFQVECWGLSIDLEGNKEGGEGGGFLLASIETKNVGTNSKGKVYAEQLQPKMD